ncbi:hypothetical protein Ntsu_55570 [Nocardia sp. IFM 10818]
MDAFAGSRTDRRDIPLVTIDPPGAMDLDQALYLERTATGFLLHYAIADVAAFVTPGGPLARESLTRGQTFYFPDGTVPLHPRVLSEGRASLLPEVDRAAALWTIELDENAEPLRYSVERALVRSRARLDYATVQADADAGRLHPSITALPAFGRLRIEAGLQRGAISLRLPAQSVIRHDEDGKDNHWQLVIEPRTAADDWNEQVSLLTGICAARIMLDGNGSDRLGLLRTMPPPAPAAIESMRRTAAAVGVDWPADEQVGRMLAGLDPNTPPALVLMSEATGLLRGASYTILNGQQPDTVQHSAIGAPYAHVTAPCAASPTATPPRSACPTAPAPRSRSGSATASPPSPTPCAAPTPPPARSNAPASTSPNPPSWPNASAPTSTPWSSAKPTAPAPPKSS